jgi:hypothetical protein
MTWEECYLGMMLDWAQEGKTCGHFAILSWSVGEPSWRVLAQNGTLFCTETPPAEFGSRSDRSLEEIRDEQLERQDAPAVVSALHARLLAAGWTVVQESRFAKRYRRQITMKQVS